MPTVVQGTSLVPGREGAELVDIAGRRVMSLQLGMNDIRGLAPGIYVVRGERSRKVVVR